MSGGKKLRLTPLGDLVNRHSVMTGIKWWTDLWNEANSVADDDGDLGVFFNEKIAGLTEMRDRFYELQPRDDE